MHAPSSSLFRLGHGYWGPISEDLRQELLFSYIGRAKDLIPTDFPVPEDDRLAIIVQAAMESRMLYFAAAMYEPSAKELDSFFDDFVMRAIGCNSLFAQEGDQ
jgi:hypothetical protein